MAQDHILIEYLLPDQYVSEEDDTDSNNLQTDSLRPVQRCQASLEAKKVMDEMPGGFFMYHADSAGEIIYANKALFRIFNCKTQEEFEEWTGNTFPGMVHPDDLEAVLESIEQQIEASQYDLDYVEYRIIQKGGEIRWVEDYGHFIHSDSAGDVFYVFLVDATEKHRHMQEEKAALLDEKRKKEERLQSQIEAYDRKMEVINREQLRRLEMIEGLSIDYESIFYVDFNGRIFQPYRISSRIPEHFRKKCQAFDLREFRNFFYDYAEQWVHPEDRKSFLSSLECGHIREKLSGQKVFHINYRIIAEGKIEYRLICVVNVGNLEQGTQAVIGCRSVDKEIQHEREQNGILEEALGQANASNMAKNIFLSNMSHDIRTPMNAIMGFTTLAKLHRDDGEKLNLYLDKIEEAADQMIQLLDDVLELSRVKSDKLHIKESLNDLREIVQDVKTAVLRRAEAKGLRFFVDLDGLEHPEVYVDRRHLFQSLVRLADNAVKYTPEGGTITISVAEQRASHGFASCRFSVEDTGVGIRSDFLEHIFEPFERQNNTTMSGVRGTGLGLTIAKNLVEMMGGKIEISSTFGEGSRFTIALILRLYEEYEEVSEPVASQPRKEACGQGPGRILLVEDNEINREIEEELLTNSGFLVDTAVDGSVAVQKVQDSAPGYYDLILMDIQMPVMDGYSATRAIRGLENPSLANIPIVALSANSFEEDRKMSMDSGMNAHMAKPVHLGQLLKVIESFTGRKCGVD